MESEQWTVYMSDRKLVEKPKSIYRSTGHRMKFAFTPKEGLSMLNAVNNCVDTELLNRKELDEHADKLNAANNTTTFGNEKGHYHFKVLDNALRKKGFRSTKHNTPNGNHWDHDGVANFGSGKYIVIGRSAPDVTHTVAVDADSQLTICDTLEGYAELSPASISASVPYGISQVLKLEQLNPQ